MSFATLQDALTWVHARLDSAGLCFGHGTDNAWDESVFLVLSALGLPLDSGKTVLQQPVSEAGAARIREWVRARIDERVPLPYLTGEAWFAGLSFRVTPEVLIPRSPLAELIDTGFQPWLGTIVPRRILDLCTGSGCIGIACAHAFPEARVDLADISPAALALAEDNCRRHSLGDRVQVWQTDLFDGLGRDEPYDLIVSNPPYVDADDLATLPEEYRHEPRLGLEAGEDGLRLVRRILTDAADRLSANGLLVVEVGNSRPALEAAYPTAPFAWPVFTHGGHGVFVLSAGDVRAL